MMMNAKAQKLKETFEKKFEKLPILFYSPGRINLLGEHVDYNDGFVMPCAIDKGIYLAIAPNHTQTVNFFARDLNEALSIPLDQIEKKEEWKNYVLSVINEYQQAGKVLGGFDCVFSGNLPIGAGLSSSAALTAGLAFSLNELFHIGYDRLELAKLSQKAEHGYPGVKCGIMDQYANLFGRKNEAIYLDCRSLTHEYIPLYFQGFSIILINSNVKHALASSEYNNRRHECETGLKIIRENSHFKAFRDIKKIEVLDKFEEKMGKYVLKRCKFVVGEIQRTRTGAKLLKRGKIEEFGQLMYKSHEGLRDLYKVSCSELDFLVTQATLHESVVGSRMMGAGFGGCTINLVKTDEKDTFIADTLAAYKKEFQQSADAYEVQVSDGTNRVTVE